MTKARIVCSAVALLAFAFASHGALAATPVPCSQLRYMRDLAPDLQYVSNPDTGDKLDYVVVGDAAVSNEVLVFFNGTGQIIPDWPIQMITNSTYSPKIVGTIGYKKSEDGPVSLCHDFYLLFFDYPGVGKNIGGYTNGSPVNAFGQRYRQVTKDQVSSDVNAILQNAGMSYGISTNIIDPVGWSLGTTDALKFSLLSPKARPWRTIHNILLIATDPGGYVTPKGYGAGSPAPDEASCVGTLFAALADKTSGTGRLARRLDAALTKLTFPYKGQTRHDNGTNSGCTATVNNDTVNLSVTLHCTIANNCVGFLLNSILNRETYPWKLTHGIDHTIYVQQRAQGNDWGADYCAGAGPAFTSIDCESYNYVKQSVTNGGVCRTDTTLVNRPVSVQCADLDFTGKIAVLNGYEDLYVQWAYGKALVNAYNQKVFGSAVLFTYPGKAGHGIMIQHPMWTQERIASVFASEPGSGLSYSFHRRCLPGVNPGLPHRACAAARAAPPVAVSANTAISTHSRNRR